MLLQVGSGALVIFLHKTLPRGADNMQDAGAYRLRGCPDFLSWNHDGKGGVALHQISCPLHSPHNSLCIFVTMCAVGPIGTRRHMQVSRLSAVFPLEKTSQDGRTDGGRVG